MCSSLKVDIKIEGLVYDRTSLTIRVGMGSSRDIYGVEEVITELRKTDRRESLNTSQQFSFKPHLVSH